MKLPVEYQVLRDQMAEYYRPLQSPAQNWTSSDPRSTASCQSERVPASRPKALHEQEPLWRRINAEMEKIYAAEPSAHPSILKARLQETIAEQFTPRIFTQSPFFFEMGVRPAENWGTPFMGDAGRPPMPAAGLLHWQNRQGSPHPEGRWLNELNVHNEKSEFKLWVNGGGFDVDHHCPGYTQLLREGVNGLLGRIAARRAAGGTADQLANWEAMTRSLRALLLVAARFRAEAARLLAEETEPLARRFLAMIETAAGRVPAEPPRTFYEGLAALWFLREATASLEGIGISVVGHPDRQLIALYRADRQAGRLTEAEAADLVARWLLPTDVKCHVWDRSWPETSTCLMLGGCDEHGDVVWNELTRLFIKTHHRLGLMTPKLNCRFSSESPREYLELLADVNLAGHNHFALINDDVLIQANVRQGKTEAEARLYVNGGCQETMCEGVEHSAGAYYYFNLMTILDHCLRPRRTEISALAPAAAALVPAPLLAAPDFESFYHGFMAAWRQALETGARWRTDLGRQQWRKHPCPGYSAGLAGCIESGRDYTAGGAKHNPGGITLVGLGSLVNSLHAVRVAVFEERWLALPELAAILAADWAGQEALRQRVLSLPRYGQGDARVDELAARLCREMAAFVCSLDNERGGRYQPSFFVYFTYMVMGAAVGATPDGRRAGEPLSQGIAPHRVRAPQSLTDILTTLGRIDFADYPGNAVLDVQLPAGGGVPAKAMAAFIRTFARAGGPTLQLNVASAERMRAAQAKPEEHRDLVVRISGLSACFVSLAKGVQDELIGRAVMKV